MFFHFTTFIIKHVTKILKLLFFYFVGLQNASKIVFHGFRNLVIWFWKNVGNFVKGVCGNPVYKQMDNF